MTREHLDQFFEWAMSKADDPGKGAMVSAVHSLALAGLDAEWMDIKEAPRDGTAILACEMPHAWIGVLRFKDGCWSIGDGYPFVTPTHYRPLPAPPSAGVGV